MTSEQLAYDSWATGRGANYQDVDMPEDYSEPDEHDIAVEEELCRELDEG